MHEDERSAVRDAHVYEEAIAGLIEAIDRLPEKGHTRRETDLLTDARRLAKKFTDLHGGEGPSAETIERQLAGLWELVDRNYNAASSSFGDISKRIGELRNKYGELIRDYSTRWPARWKELETRLDKMVIAHNNDAGRLGKRLGRIEQILDGIVERQNQQAVAEYALPESGPIADEFAKNIRIHRRETFGAEEIEAEERAEQALARDPVRPGDIVVLQKRHTCRHEVVVEKVEAPAEVVNPMTGLCRLCGKRFVNIWSPPGKYVPGWHWQGWRWIRGKEGEATMDPYPYQVADVIQPSNGDPPADQHIEEETE